MRKERPMLFSTEMVKAILDDRKTQTRRICKRQPTPHTAYNSYKDGTFNICGADYDSNDIKCPYGSVGDVLWVRETWLNVNAIDEEPGYVFKADNPNWMMASGEHWKPSIHMPKKAARIWLEITNIRVERLHEITELDAMKEGILRDPLSVTKYHNYLDESFPTYSAKHSFKSLWVSINGDESWLDNPWVWVVEFKRIEKP
jgi:hypothetical protein